MAERDILDFLDAALLDLDDEGEASGAAIS